MIKIEVTDSTRSCKVEGTLLEISVNTVVAIQSIIEAMKKADVDAAEKLKERLPMLCRIACLDVEEISRIADFIKRSKEVK